MAHGPTAAAKTHAPLERALTGAVGTVFATLLVACGCVLAARRMGGGFAPVGGTSLVAVALLGGLLVLAVDAASRLAGLPAAWRTSARVGYALAWAAVGLPPAFRSATEALVFLVATSLAGAIVAEPLVRGRAGSWLADLRRRMPRPPSGLRPPRLVTPPSTARPVESAGRVLQRFERSELDGVDRLRGTLTLTVPQGARAAHGHVGFCPSFRHVPAVEATTAYDGVEAVITAAEVVPWGVRIECRLDEPAEEPVEIPVEVVARSPV
jgi:hypothetical protein